MATKKIGQEVPIALNDGTEVVLRPLNIKKLKEFMAKFRKINTLDDEELTDTEREVAFMDIVVDMAAISLSTQLKEQTEYLYKTYDSEEERLEAREKWEEMVDQDTVAYINEICGGIKFGGNTADDADFPTGRVEG